MSIAENMPIFEDFNVLALLLYSFINIKCYFKIKRKHANMYYGMEYHKFGENLTDDRRPNEIYKIVINFVLYFFLTIFLLFFFYLVIFYSWAQTKWKDWKKIKNWRTVVFLKIISKNKILVGYFMGWTFVFRENFGIFFVQFRRYWRLFLCFRGKGCTNKLFIKIQNDIFSIFVFRSFYHQIRIPWPRKHIKSHQERQNQTKRNLKIFTEVETSEPINLVTSLSTAFLNSPISRWEIEAKVKKSLKNFAGLHVGKSLFKRKKFSNVVGSISKFDLQK